MVVGGPIGAVVGGVAGNLVGGKFSITKMGFVKSSITRLSDILCWIEFLLGISGKTIEVVDDALNESRETASKSATKQYAKKESDK